MLFARTLTIFILHFVSKIMAHPENINFRGKDLDHDLTVLRRSAYDHGEIYTRDIDCGIEMIGIKGEYHYTSNGNGGLCVAYLLAEEDEIVEIEIKDATFECDDNSHFQWFDGWSMGTGFFPSVSDHSLNISDRVQSVCRNDDSPMVFTAHQNAAMVTFKLDVRGTGFTLIMKPKETLAPCNVMAQNPSGITTIRNYGAAQNCSFSVIYPIHVGVITMRIGEGQHETTLRCNATDDYVEFLVGNNLDPSYMRQDDVLCGSAGGISQIRHHGNTDENLPTNALQPIQIDDVIRGDDSTNTIAAGLNILLSCQNSVVRLVSSGQRENAITIEYRRSFPDKNDCDFPLY